MYFRCVFCTNKILLSLFVGVGAKRKTLNEKRERERKKNSRTFFDPYWGWDVCENEREREREIMPVCMCVCVFVCLYVCLFVLKKASWACYCVFLGVRKYNDKKKKKRQVWGSP